MNLSAEERALLADSEEVEIETRSADGTVHRTIIWVVVDGSDVLIRSVRGEVARWYRQAVADPNAALHAAGRRIPVLVEAAADAASIASCSQALTVKYRNDPSLASMLVPKTLPTTMRVLARV